MHSDGNHRSKSEKLVGREEGDQRETQHAERVPAWREGRTMYARKQKKVKMKLRTGHRPR